jgi:hypothetical protein
MALSKPFVIATEGPTIDGRNISKEKIIQMAASYDPKVYTAVGNLEHLLSYSPDSLFSAYGKVVKLGTQEADILGEKKTQLTAIVDANDSIVAMQKAGKKAFASIEIAENFLGKGIAYLSGLAFTDTPAAIGTESMKFSATQQNIYSFKDELSVEFDSEQPSEKAGESLFARVVALLKGDKKDNDSRFSDIGKAVEAIATSQKETLEKFSEISAQDKTVSGLRAELDAMKKADEDRTTAFNTLKAEVEKLAAQPNAQGKRPSATGGDGSAATDC